MKYYVIINGNSSLNIQGLAIESLPNISKPLIRTSREEIDGRDGDIITKLGYSAYDKTLNIGLWGNYDINEVIAFFNQEGVITFSNEPDKYYKFTIVNRIDFVNELEKFKKASITIHCQPFKYQEQPEIVAEEEAVELTGTSFKITDSLEAPLIMDLKGNTSQNTLSGKNKLNKTLVDDSWRNANNTTQLSTGLKVSCREQGVYRWSAIPIPNSSSLLGKTLTISADVVRSGSNQAAFAAQFCTSSGLVQEIAMKDTTSSSLSLTFTVSNSFPTGATGIAILVYSTVGTTANVGDYVEYKNLQLEEGSTSTSYEPYCGGIPSPNPSYPQNVNVVSGDNDIVVCGKNLFDMNTISSSSIITINNNQTLTINGKGVGGVNFELQRPIILKANTTYTMALSNYYANDKLNIIFRTTASGSNVISVNTASSSITPNEDIALNYLRVFTDGTTTFNNYTTGISIINDNSSTYEAYNGTTYNIDLPVENLFDSTIMQGGLGANGYDTTSTIRLCTNSFIKVKPNTQYIISFKTTNGINNLQVNFYQTASFPRFDATEWINTAFTTPNNCNYIQIAFRKSDNSTITPSNISDIQIEEGTKANAYTPYGTTPIELCKIGTYQDYIYKEDDKWYLHKEVGKLTFDGTEAWSLFFNTNGIFVYNPSSQSLLTDDTINGLSNYYTCTTRKYIRNNLSEADNVFSIYAQELVVANKSISSAADFKTWLSTHRLNVYYILKTPTNTEITYQPLINQLNALEDAESYEGTTNINQANNDLPFIIGLTYFTGDNTITITNDGNIYSKPLLRIKGTSDISISLNGIQIFQITLQNNEIIIIDTEKMEAYYDGILKNRQVIGDYNNFKLNPGENTIEINGAFDYVRISRYSRWV